MNNKLLLIYWSNCVVFIVVNHILYRILEHVVCVLSYAVFLWCLELVQLKRSDICFCDNYMTLFIHNSKTDCYREGNNVIISCTDEITCPVKMTRRCLTLAKMNDQSDQYLFRSVTYYTYCNNSNKYIVRGDKYVSISQKLKRFFFLR